MTKPLDELNTFEKEITESFSQLTDSQKLLESLSNLVIEKAQAAVNAANETGSYDDKLDSLIKGIQDIVKTVTNVRDKVSSATEKHNSDLQLLQRLRTRFSDSEKIEKKTRYVEESFDS